MKQNQAHGLQEHNATQLQYTPPAQDGQSKPFLLRRRMGTTTYRVRVHFSETGTETAGDTILRLVRNEAMSG